MNIANFTTALSSLPYTPTRPEARGIIAPIIRATGHLLFLLAHISEPAGSTHTPLTPEEELNELAHAATHLTAGNLPDDIPTISAATLAHIGTFRLGVINIHTSWASWPADGRTAALRDLTNRAAALGTILDRELTGIAPATLDPGSSL